MRYREHGVASLESVLDRNKGLGPGFDFVRIALSLAVAADHSFRLTNNEWILSTPLWFGEYCLVPMFFALSGFLISGSAMRLSLGNFLINRGLRIVPALAVDVVICAIIIGPLVTTYTMGTYFSDARFYTYFLNIVGYIHYLLPGVFETHPNPRVNVSLWTVCYEIICYIFMATLIFKRWIRKPAYVFSGIMAILIFGMVFERQMPSWNLPGPVAMALNYVFVVRGSQQLLAFLMGVLLYQLRGSIPYSKGLFFVCCAISVVGMFYLNMDDVDRVDSRFVFLPALVYITVFLGLTRIPIPQFLHRGDYSYGIYLYHCPIIQVVIGIIPAIALFPGYGALVVDLIVFPAVFGIAFCSWHFIEKPILKLRKKFSFVARVRGVATEKELSVAPLEVTAADTGTGSAGASYPAPGDGQPAMGSTRP